MVVAMLGATTARDLPAQSVPLELKPATGASVFSFPSIRSVRELSDGRVLVASVSDPILAIVDLASGAVRQIGREGRGPGEYRDADRIHALGGDSSMVEDRRSRRWLYLDGDRFIATITTWRVGWQSPEIAGIDRSGRLLELRATRYGQSTEAPVMLVRVNAESLAVLVHQRAADVFTEVTAQVDTLAVIRGPWGGLRVGRGVDPAVGEMLYELRNPLSVGDQAVLFRDGWIAVAYVEPYRVAWYAPDDQRARLVAIAHDRIRLDDREKQFAARAYAAARVRDGFKPEDFPNWPQYLPPFHQDALVAAPDGHLLVERTRSADRPNERFYDVVGRTGNVTRQLRMRANERIVGAGLHSVYVAVTDRDGLQQLRRHPWP